VNTENTKYLIEHFPILYRGVDEPITQNLMSFGFECGDGWFNLIKDLSEKIEDYNNSLGDDEYPCIAVQVKEKYGTLRFYVNGGTDEIFNWIDEAETKSEKTCEVCGDPGELKTSGWCMVRCSKH
jgi:hypothetical protein